MHRHYTGLRCLGLWLPWRDACQWTCTHFGITPAVLYKFLYEPCFSSQLLVFVADKDGSLDWKRLWRCGEPEVRACGLWVQAARLDAARRLRVRQRVQRFLGSCQLVRARACHITVPVLSRGQFWEFRRAVRRAVCSVLSNKPSVVQQYVLDRIRFCKSRPVRLDEAVQSHWRISNTVTLEEFDEWRPGDFADANTFSDVAWWQQCLSLQQRPDKKHICGVWERSFEKIFGTTAGTLPFLESLCGALSTRSGGFETNSLASHIVDSLGDKQLVQVDRDPKRAVAVDPAAHRARVFFALRFQPDLYKWEAGYTLDFVLNRRWASVVKYIPSAVWRHRNFVWGPHAVPAYCQIYKRKCFVHRQGGSFACDRAHAHYREVVSYARDPCRTFMRRVAKALSHLLRAGPKTSFGLQHPQRVAEVLRERCKPLARSSHCLRCSRELQGVSLIKVDATTYFQQVDASRCLLRAHSLVQRFEQKYASVLLNEKDRRKTKLLERGKRVPNGWRQITMEDLHAALSFAETDVWLRAGELCVQRVRGLPMGGPLSPGLTTLDLDECVRSALDSKQKSREVGWSSTSFPSVRKNVAGVIFVDDMLFFSTNVCDACLQNGIRLILPDDIGLSWEHCSMGVAAVEFLHTLVYVRECFTKETGFFTVVPLDRNSDFARGKDLHPFVAKIPVFCGFGASAKSEIRSYVTAKMVLVESTLEGKFTEKLCRVSAVNCIASIICECLRLGWPRTWIADVCRCFLFYRRTDFAELLRLCGRKLRKSRQIPLLFDHDFPDEWWKHVFADVRCLVEDCVETLALPEYTCKSSCVLASPRTH
jgi:hypothetical protein